MNSLNDGASNSNVADFLGEISDQGVKLWTENGTLRFKAPRGILTAERIATIKARRNEIVALMEGKGGREDLAVKSGRQVTRAPLAFSQLFMWNLLQMSRRPSYRCVASATSLRGTLDANLLQLCIIEMTRRHAALRTRIVIANGTLVQEIDDSVDFELRIDDLTVVPRRDQHTEVTRAIHEEILRPVDIAVGPLFALRLLKLHSNEHVLIIAMDHIISDAFSLNILLRDLLEAYAQGVSGRDCLLPEIPVQFFEYALWQNHVLEAWFKRHGEYWRDRLTGYRAVRFPLDEQPPNAIGLGWSSASVQLGKELKRELREYCRTNKTTLVMSVLTAYVALVLRWCNTSDIVVQLQINGRMDPKVENAIGYFASVLYLRLGISETDTFADLSRRVTEEYCEAYEHADAHYLGTRTPTPEFARGCWFNWVPYFESAERSDHENRLEVQHLSFSNPALRKFEWDNDPELVLFETADDVVGGVYFPLNRFSVDSMDRLGCNLLRFVRASIREPCEPVMGLPLV